MFKLLEALWALFDLGFELTEDDFRELTDEEYACADRKGEATGERLYRIRDLSLLANKRPADTLLLCDEEDRALLLEAVRYVYRATDGEGRSFTSFKERMLYVRGRLPKRGAVSKDGSQDREEAGKLIPFPTDPDGESDR